MVFVRFLDRSFRHWSLGRGTRVWSSSIFRVQVDQQQRGLGASLGVRDFVFSFSEYHVIYTTSAFEIPDWAFHITPGESRMQSTMHRLVI